MERRTVSIDDVIADIEQALDENASNDEILIPHAASQDGIRNLPPDWLTYREMAHNHPNVPIKVREHEITPYQISLALAWESRKRVCWCGRTCPGRRVSFCCDAHSKIWHQWQMDCFVIGCNQKTNGSLGHYIKTIKRGELLWYQTRSPILLRFYQREVPFSFDFCRSCGFKMINAMGKYHLNQGLCRCGGEQRPNRKSCQDCADYVKDSRQWAKERRLRAGINT